MPSSKMDLLKMRIVYLNKFWSIWEMGVLVHGDFGEVPKFRAWNTIILQIVITTNTNNQILRYWYGPSPNGSI